MLRGAFESAGNVAPEDLLSAYGDLLAETIRQRSVDTVAEESGVEREMIETLADGAPADLSLEEAAAILATDPDRPAADVIESEARDILLMGMSTAVLDVEAVASGIEDELEPKEIQQKVEGRYPMSLREYAILHSFIESRKP